MQLQQQQQQAAGVQNPNQFNQQRFKQGMIPQQNRFVGGINQGQSGIVNNMSNFQYQQQQMRQQQNLMWRPGMPGSSTINNKPVDNNSGIINFNKQNRN